MDIDAFIERVERRISELGLTDRGASMDATGKPDLIRNIKKGQWPSADRAQSLAQVLKTTVEWLVTGNESATAGSATPAAPALEPQHLSEAIKLVELYRADLPLDKKAEVIAIVYEILVEGAQQNIPKEYANSNAIKMLRVVNG